MDYDINGILFVVHFLVLLRHKIPESFNVNIRNGLWYKVIMNKFTDENTCLKVTNKKRQSMYRILFTYSNSD